jgi:hypothetical protein
VVTTAVAGLVTHIGVVAPVAVAQSGTQTAAARRDAGRSVGGVLLLVRPRVGDTLRLQMEQTIEVSSRPASPAARSTAPVINGTNGATRTTPNRPPEASEYGPRRSRTSMRITRLTLYAHSLVEASDLTVTTLLATTDSMAMWAGAPGASGEPEMMPLPAEGRQVRVRVTPDGAMRVNDPPPGAMELGATLAAMPGMLPSTMVRVGDRWERDIVLPSLPVSGYRADGVVRARFRLDSLTHGGRDAWISLEGSLHRDGAARELPAGTRVITAGTMRGLLVVDRQRAWIIDARTTMDVQSEVMAGPGSSSAPLLLDLRIQQRVKVK